MRRRFAIALLLILMLVLVVVIPVQFVHLADASPGNEWVSRSQNYVDEPTDRVTDPTKAYDKDPGTYAYFKYSDADGKFELYNFSVPTEVVAPLPNIENVSFNMRYYASPNTGAHEDTYRIAYYVPPNTTAQTLVDWRTDYSVDLYVDGFDDSKIYWNRAGDSPYLDAKEDGNYIYEAMGVLLRPDGDGTYYDWTGDWTDWDEKIPDDTTYVSADADNLHESSTIEDPLAPLPTGTHIDKVMVTINASNTMVSNDKLNITLVIGGTEYSGHQEIFAPLPSWGQIESYWTKNPATNKTWTWDNITDLEVGVKSIMVGSWEGEIRVTQMFVEVFLIGATIGDFSFEDLPGGADVGKVGLELYSRSMGPAWNDLLEVTLYNGIAWTTIGTIIPCDPPAEPPLPPDYHPIGEWAWESLIILPGVNLIEILGTPTAINATKVCLTKLIVDGGRNELYPAMETIEVDAMRLKVFTKGYVEEVTAVTWPPTSDLTEDAAAGQPNCTVWDGSKFSAGDKVEIKDDNNSEHNEVASVSGNTVTMVNNLAHTYIEAAKGKVRLRGVISEPNDGTWDWNEVNSIRFAVETDKVGTTADDGCIFEIYEVWLTIDTPNASLTVRPMRVTDYTTTPHPPVQNMTIRPNADGAKFLWFPEPPTQDRWDCVDEVPPNNDTDYVYAAGSYRGCSFHLEDPVSQSWEIASVRVVVYARYEATTDEKLLLMLVFGTSMYMASLDYGEQPTVEYTLTGSYEKYSYDWGVNPATDVPWNWADLADMQGGVYAEPTGSWTGEIRVTQLYVEVIGPRFTFDVMAEDVANMWGYHFVLGYDTSWLTATGFVSASPFTYGWPSEINDAAGYVSMFYSMPTGTVEGASGNRTCATIVFLVEGFGRSYLDLSDTQLMDPEGLTLIHNVYDGYFSNMIPGDIQGDTGGTPPDGDVDMFDFFAFADHYATVEGDPKYNILADLQGDTPESYPYPDGDVDMFDFFAFADNYGKSI